MSSSYLHPDPAQAARARRNIYKFLAGCFLSSPSADTLGTLLEGETLDDLAGAYGEAAVQDLRQLDVSEADVRKEFDRLFVVPVDGFVSPCESVHVAGDQEGPKQLYGAPCSDVGKLMLEAGTRLPPDLAAPPDHIAVELLFLAHLCDEEGTAAADGHDDAAQRWTGRQILFLRTHPAAWIGTLAERIRASAPSGFYAAVAALTERVLTKDLRRLDEA